MRLCDVTMFWSPTGGGVRRYIEKKREWLASAHPLAEHMVVVPGACGKITSEGRRCTAAVRGLPLPFAPGYRMPILARGVVRALEGWQPAFVECGSPFLMRRAVSGWSRRSGRPVCDYYHAYFPLNYTAVFRGRHPLLASIAEARGWSWLRRVYADSSRVFVAAGSVRDRLASEGITNTELAPLGVDLGLFAPAPGGGRPPVPTILFVGRLSEEKGLSEVLDCFALLAAGRDLRMVVVGDGIMRRRVEALASRDERVRFAGYLDSPGLAREYRSASVLVSGAPAETLGLTFLEALASGTPVVGLSGSGLMDEFPPGVAAAAPRRDAALLAQSVASMLDAPPDPEACRAAVSRFGWDERLEYLLCREMEMAGIGGDPGLGA